MANVAVQAFSLFRVDRTITGSKVTLDEFAVTAPLSERLMELGLNVIYMPSAYDMTANGS